LAGWSGRQAFFLDAIDRFDRVKPGDAHYMTVQFMKTMKVDRVAAAHLLGSFADTQPDDLAAFAMPAAVVCGRDDRDNGDPQALVDALPDATLYEVPGTHMSSVTKPELGQAIADFLAA
ncbi:MAG: alpha/beta hydrolase, partial [Sphingomonadales bacterium]|nr:alpha/beta hydrolase [Sphingomonadales bacterium]